MPEADDDAQTPESGALDLKHALKGIVADNETDMHVAAIVRNLGLPADFDAFFRKHRIKRDEKEN